MSRDAIHDLTAVKAELAAAQAILRRQHATIEAIQKRLEAALEAPVQDGIQQGLHELPPATEHRREHRPGRPVKIDADPELAAFVAARIDRMTFHQLAAAVAETFPPARRVGKSAIHAWWQRRQKHRTHPTHPG